MAEAEARQRPTGGRVEERTTVVVRGGAPAQRSPVATYIGIALTAIGFVLIGLAWNGAAGLNFIQGQFPFLISGGLTGIGLIIVGVTIMIVETMQRDAADRTAQLRRLTATVARLHGHLAPPDPFDPSATGEYRPRPRDAGNGHRDAQTDQLPPQGQKDTTWESSS